MSDEAIATAEPVEATAGTDTGAAAEGGNLEASQTDAAPSKAGSVAEDKGTPSAQRTQGRSNADILADAERKFQENPNYQYTKEELDAFEADSAARRRQPKGKKGSQVGSPDAAQQGEEAETPKVDDQPKVNPHNNPKLSKAMETVGAKSLDELPDKIAGLKTELDRLHGERGKLGSVQQLRQAYDGQHAMIRDILLGKPEAIAEAARIHNIQPQQSPAQAAPAQRQNVPNAQGQAQPGKYDNFLDPELAKHVDERLQKLDAVEQFYKQEMDKRAVDDARSETLNELHELMAAAPELYDSKKHGPLRAQMEKYWNTRSEDPIPESVKRIIDVLQIAAEHKFTAIKPAYELWAYRNRGSLGIEVARQATQAFTGRKATVGLSDQQQGKDGQVYTVREAEKMASGEIPIPEDWIHPRTGQLMADKMPPEIRSILFAGRKT